MTHSAVNRNRFCLVKSTELCLAPVLHLYKGMSESQLCGACKAGHCEGCKGGFHPNPTQKRTAPRLCNCPNHPERKDRRARP